MNSHGLSPALNDLPERRGRILIVDDQPININAIHQIFSEEHEVFMATSGEQALEFCRKTPPDIVLLDVVMPGMDGLEVCRHLKEDAIMGDIPVIFVTSHQHTDDETACWEAGAVDFVNKPANPTTLRRRVRAHLMLKLQADILREMVFIDGMTKIANRRCFDVRLEAEIRRCSRHRSAVGLIMIDVDYFKRYNDLYGHQAGDVCLRLIAGALQKNIKRPFDLAARYGGEEFACLLPQVDLTGAVTVANKLEAVVRGLGIEHLASDVDRVVTVSMGVASLHPEQNDTGDLLVNLADTQLYRAKHEGRGRVCSHD